MKKLLLIAVFVFHFLSLSAQTWIKEQAPNVQNVSKMYSDTKGGLYIKGGTRMFKKINNAEWTEMKVAGTQMSVGAFSIYRDTLYFLKPSGFSGDVAVYRSIDQGDSWTALETGSVFSGYYVSPTLFYKDGVFLTSDNYHIYRSLDNGNTWTVVYTSVYFNVIEFKFFDGKILCNTINSWALSSSDMGVNWSDLKTNLPNPATYSLVTNSSYAIISTVNGVAFLAPGASSWEKRSTGLPATTTGIYLATSGDTVFAVSDKIYASYNQGLTWTEIFPPNRPNSSLMVSVLLTNSSILIGGPTGVHVSDREDVSFRSLNKGLIPSGNFIYNVAQYKDSIFKASGSGLYKRHESEIMNWEYSGTNLRGPRGVYNFDDVLYAVGGGGISKSTDGGTTWTSTSFGLVTVDRLVYNGETIFAGTNNGVFRSSDMGETWPAANGGVAHSNTVLYVNGNKLYAADNYGSNPGVWYSTDNGQTYTNIKGNITETKYKAITEIGGNTFIVVEGPEKLYKAPSGTNNWTVVEAGNYPTNIYSSHGLIFLADLEGIYISKDQGTNWELINDGLTFQDYSLSFSMIENDTLYATGGTDPKIYKLSLEDILVTSTIDPSFKTSLMAFPNPADDYVVIQAGSTDRLFSLRDYSGKIVKEFNIGKEESKLDISELASGFYTYRVVGQDITDTGKLIIK